MHRLAVFLAGVLGAVALAAPLVSFALGTSFGGTILKETPCISPLGPAIWFSIFPAGTFPIFYIWTPITLGLPPTHPGQQILGLADVPFGCGIPGPHGLIPLPPGQRVQLEGVSQI